MSKRDAAKAAAKIDFKVFPLEPNGKKPIITGWQERATSDPDRAYEWWTDALREERDWNIGILCDGLLIVDIDAKQGAEKPFDTLLHFEKKYGPAPTVETPSGGYHIYYRLPEGVRLGNTTKKIAPNIDTRSTGGYVLAPGSSGKNGKNYEWIESDVNFIPGSIADLPLAPQEIIDQCDAPKERAPVDPDTEWDAPAATAWAINYLKHDAKPSIMFNGGDANAFDVALDLRDVAISRDAAIVLMLEHWNRRCKPPWDPIELDQKVENAYKYGKNRPSASNVPGAEFEDQSDQKAVATDWPSPTILEPFDPAAIPKRDHVLRDIAVRKNVTGLVAPSGAGKTQLLAQIAVAIATGRPDIVHSKDSKIATVWWWNQEDDLDELKRRIGATMEQFGISWSDVGNRLRVNSGTDKRLVLAALDETGKRLEITPNVDRLARKIKEEKIDVLILDPLVGFHQADENSSGQMDMVGDSIRKLAISLNIAIIFAHHTRKPPGASADGFAGNSDSGRGSTALNATTRATYTLYAMSSKEAKKLKIDEADRSRYVRLDHARGNIAFAPEGSRPIWFKRTGQKLGPEGEEVGVLVPVEITVSRLKEETESELEVRAKAVAKAMISLGQGDGQWHDYPAAREKASALLGLADSRGGTMAKFATENIGEQLPAGEDHRIEFRKSALGSKAIKVRVLSNTDGASRGQDASDAPNLAAQAPTSAMGAEVQNWLA